MKTRAMALAVLILGAPGWAQDRPDEKKLTFNFKEASVDGVLQYVSTVTGWIFVQEKAITGKVDAVSDTDVPVTKCLEFLDSALRRHGVTTFNPYSPSLPKPGQIVKIVDVEESKRRNIEIHTGADPEAIPVSDRVRTQIMPLKAVNVSEVQKELGEVLRKAIEPDGQMAISTYSNSVVLTGRADGINRAARILRVIDVSTSAELKIRVFALKNADATETSKTLNEVFKREAMKADSNAQNPMAGFFRMFRGGGEGDRGGGSPQPRALASEMVRITGDTRTNSVIVSATEDNMKIIEDLITRLDDKSAAVIKLKLYPLRYADATSAAKLITDTFADTSGGGSSGGGRGGRGGMVPIWMGGQPAQPGDVHAAKEVKAVPDMRTNSVLVAASEQNLLLIDDLMAQLDRQVNDILEVKIYKLQNADPVEMATILQALFRPQIQATQQSGRTTGGQSSQQGGGNFFRQMMGMGGGGGTTSSSGGLPPSQEVEITSDTRTRAVIVKASREYIAIMDDVVRQLDLDPTEALSTYVVPVKNHTATELATTFQNLMRSTGTGTQSRTSTQQGAFGNQQLFGNRSNTGNTSSRNTGSTRSSSTRSTGTRTRNLGPIQEEGGQDTAPAGESQDEEMPRRALEGQVDVQADTTTNSLVIRTSPRNFQAIQSMLNDLDRMRPQVLIKVLITEVTLDDRTKFGVEGFWENKMTVRGGDKANNRLETDFPLLARQGFTYLLSGDEFQATLNAFASEGKLRVMATPRIMVLDNQTANINVGKEVPIITNSTINSLGNPVNTVQYQSVGIMLDVTPHINPDGLVTMLVAPEISDIASASESVEITPGATSPTFNVNNASTTVAVRSGTTVVIGGLIRETTDDAVQKIPLFGDIPVLGVLFSNTSKIKVKRELMIFLTPYVAFTAAEIEEITELEKSRLKILDLRDIDSESDRWLERLRH